MIMVDPNSAVVDAEIARGRFKCPYDNARMILWGRGRRRVVGGVGYLCPRRMRCTISLATHVLLPRVLLLRRADRVDRIGRQLELAATGMGYRKVAQASRASPDTVRRRIVRCCDNTSAVAAAVTRIVAQVDPMAPHGFGSGVIAVVDAAGKLASALRRARGIAFKAAPWRAMSQATGGRMLSPRYSPV